MRARLVSIVVSGSSGPEQLDSDPDSLRAEVARLEAEGTPRKEAIVAVAKAAGLPKREVYNVVHTR